ncbi:beta/alpha barrel domain-containing protein [Algihabitans albus]|uniref:hypothetical protein n=1 Tax=Algihabitans albus TaxID=2164067 RepID=UPI000E5CBAD5|nr:hypothetical protein [Algihabitans albus]
MDFIFMLTREDQTVEDCLAVFEEIRSVGVCHIGFKDLGADRGTLEELNRRIKDSGAVSYMEVVATSREDVLRSAGAAREIGVDRLMGGTELEAVQEILEGSGIGFYPFPGRPEGHPTKLGGTPELIEAHCRDFMKRGCAGADLLAFRATEAEPLELVRAARRGLGGQGQLVVAGSVDCPARIRSLAEAGADAFTIGSAAFDGAFSPRKGSLRSQLQDILTAAAETGPELQTASAG